MAKCRRGEQPPPWLRTTASDKKIKASMCLDVFLCVTKYPEIVWTEQTLTDGRDYFWEGTGGRKGIFLLDFLYSLNSQEKTCT